MLKPVTEDLLYQLSDCDSLDQIEVLSFKYVEDGQHERHTNVLKVVSLCPNLSILYLQGNLLNVLDLSYLQSFENLKRIDLSNNQLEMLPPASVFAGLESLQFLYLHNNSISKWQDLQSLVALPRIMHITLFANPVCSIPGYRHFVVNSVPCLKALDNYVITDEERIEDASFGNRFRGLNEYMKWHLTDYSDEPSAEQHKFNLEVDIYRLKRCYERNSPSILIQSLFRGYKSRNFFKFYFQQRTKNALYIQKHVRGWLQRKKFMRDLKDMLAYTQEEDLLLPTEQIERRDKARIIFRNMYRYWQKKQYERRLLASTLKIQAYYRGRFIKHSSFVNALELSKYPKIYFLKEQKPQFVKILHSQISILQQDNLTLDDALDCIQEDRKFETIRVEEPDLFEWKPLPLLQFIMPTFGKKTIIRFNKTLGLDKRANEEFSLNDFLYTDDQKTTSRMLSKLRKRNYNLKMANLKAQLASRKKKTFLNQMVFYDKYNDFLVFEGPSVKLVLSILFAILDYNRTIDTNEDQQFLCFFEPLLDKAAKITMIQQNIRAALFRRSLKQYPIYMIIKRRAVYRIQEWWRNLKFKKRVVAMGKIRQHAMQINSPQLYIEQTLYNNINEVITGALSGFRFTEQAIMFDFNPTTFSVHMAVDEEPNNGVYRYKQLAVPSWFKVGLHPPDFMQSPYINKLEALFHFTSDDCQILPATAILNYQNCQMDIDRNLYFLQINCGSVEEARRRAIVMAYLTYDMTRHLFVKLSTSQMLEDPFVHQNIYDSHEIFGLEIKNEEVDVKALLGEQAAQPHQGMISTEKDAQVLQTTTKFKSVELNEKYLFISIRDQYEANRLDQEIVNYNKETDMDITDFAPAYEANQRIQQNMLGTGGQHSDAAEENKSGTGLKMSLWETRKLNEHHQSLLKEQLWQQRHIETQNYREQKKSFLNESHIVKAHQVDQVKQEVAKQREVKRIIKAEQSNEMTKNLSVFLNLNNEERILRQELVDKQHELQAKEKQLKIANVVHQNKVRHLKREEREKFIGSFVQAKNLIEKQMKIGNHIRDKKHTKDANKRKVQSIKNAKIDEQMALPITTKQIDGSMLMDAELSTQRSSTTNFYSADKRSQKASGGAFTIKRGRSQQMTTAPPVMNSATGIVKNDSMRRNGPAMSAQRRNPVPLHSRLGAGAGGGAPLAQGGPMRQSSIFPPLNETSFSEQYKTFKGLSGQQRTIHQIANNIEMSRDLQMRIKPTAQNKPYYRRSFKGPPALLDSTQPFRSSIGAAAMLQQQAHFGDHSVFQTNASHVLSSPQNTNTFNAMADATTAPYPYDNSMIQSALSPQQLMQQQILMHSQMNAQGAGGHHSGAALMNPQAFDYSTFTGGQNIATSTFLSPVNNMAQYASQQHQ